MKYLLTGMFLFSLTALSPLAHADTKVCFSPEGDCQEEVIKEINKARRSIDIAMYSFTSREIAQALVKAQERQVKIRMTMDTAQIKDHSSKSRYLISKRLDVKFHMGPGLMHDKFAVIDDDVVLTGSFNWTVSANRRNAENLLILTDRAIAQKYSKDFKHLWEQSGEGQSKEDQASEQ